MSADRIDRRTLNRALLARQLLLQRADLSPAAAIEHLVGMQSQSPLAHYVGLWSRLADYTPHATSELLADGDLVRTHAMRATVHLFTRRDALDLRALTQPMLTARYASSRSAQNLNGADVLEVCRTGRVLATERPLTRVELGRSLADQFPGADPDALSYAITYAEPMAQVPPRGEWGKRGPARWQTYRGWLGADISDPPRVDDIVVRYLRAFGPATVADARTWSGLAGLTEVFERLRPDLRMFRDEDDRELFDVEDAPRPGGDTVAPVRFLPEYDNVLLSHADRRRLIPDKRPVPLPAGDGARAGTVLVDGDFRATWKASIATGSALLTVIAAPALTAAETRDVEAEGQRLLAFLAPDASAEVAIER